MSTQRLIRRTYAQNTAAARMSEDERSLPGYFDACQKLSRTRSREDMALFRNHFAAAINAVSPIVAALVRDDLDLNEAINEMDPPPLGARRSPWWASTPPIQGNCEPAFDEPFGAFAQRHRHLGTVIRSPDHSLGRLGIRSRARCIDVELGLGDHVLWTTGGTAHIMMDAAIPMATAIALREGSIGQLASHPLLADDHPITNVVQHPQGWTVVTFSTGVVPYRAEIRRGRIKAIAGAAPSRDSTP